MLLLGENLHNAAAARVHPPRTAVLHAHRLQRLGALVVALRVRERTRPQGGHRLHLGQVHVRAGHRRLGA
eukprot:9142590-Pyramimonas_sp.AAC.1